MVRLAVIGSGKMGKTHLDNYKYIDKAKVVALIGNSDNTKELAANRDLKRYDNLDIAFSNEEIDIVDITTPTFTHYDIAKKAILHNKSVICEKPFTLDVYKAKELFFLAKERNCFIYVAQVVRYMKETQLLKQIVDDKRFGRVLDAEFNRLSSYPTWIQNDWLKDRDKSGLLPYDLHIHDLDLIISIFKEPKSYEIYDGGRDNIGYSEFYRFTYKYDDFQITSQASWYNASYPFTNNWRVVFENAVLVFDGNTLKAYPRDKEIINYNNKDNVKIHTAFNNKPSGYFYNQLTDFITSFEEKRESNIVKNDEVIKVLSLLNSI